MTYTREFKLPEAVLTSLPTGSVKTVVDRLGQSIADGRFSPGETIPMESDLSAEFDVSRTVLREAVKVLSAKGMVRTARRYGSRVRPFEEWHLLDPDVIRWHGPNSPMARRIYRESTVLRCMVEPDAAAFAAVNASDAQVATIVEAARSIRPDTHGVTGMIAADYAFHSTILTATGNIMLAQLNGLILALLQFSYPTGAREAPDVTVSWQEHLRVADAIAARDPGKARSEMMEMLDHNARSPTG